jgi:hypothetical protein
VTIATRRRESTCSAHATVHNSPLIGRSTDVSIPPHHQQLTAPRQCKVFAAALLGSKRRWGRKSPRPYVPLHHPAATQSLARSKPCTLLPKTSRLNGPSNLGAVGLSARLSDGKLGRRDSGVNASFQRKSAIFDRWLMKNAQRSTGRICEFPRLGRHGSQSAAAEPWRSRHDRERLHSLETVSARSWSSAVPKASC